MTYKFNIGELVTVDNGWEIPDGPYTVVNRRSYERTTTVTVDSIQYKINTGKGGELVVLEDYLKPYLSKKPPTTHLCPDCLGTLVDSDLMILSSLPPKRNVHCIKCSYRGYRLA